MRPETLEAIYIDHVFQGTPATHIKSVDHRANGVSDSEAGIGAVVRELLVVFDKGKEVPRIY